MTDESKKIPVEPMPNLNKEEQEISDLVFEQLNNNGNRIDWINYLGLPHSTAEEAIYLICLIDPSQIDEHKKNLSFFPKKSGFSESVDGLNKKITLAEREQQTSILSTYVSPIQWVEWATKKGYYIPSQLW